VHITVVLAVGLDSWRLTSQGSDLRSAGYVVISASSIRDAIEQFKVGDFDLVLLGPRFLPKIRRGSPASFESPLTHACGLHSELFRRMQFVPGRDIQDNARRS